MFKNNSNEVWNVIESTAIKWLTESAGEITSRTQQYTRVDTSQTKGSWRYVVDSHRLTAKVGSRSQNAIWEEFGTGIYALKGKGRKNVPWRYKDAKGEWHITKGKKPSRAFFQAYAALKNTIIKRAHDVFGEMKL